MLEDDVNRIHDFSCFGFGDWWDIVWGVGLLVREVTWLPLPGLEGGYSFVAVQIICPCYSID